MPYAVEMRRASNELHTSYWYIRPSRDTDCDQTFETLQAAREYAHYMQGTLGGQPLTDWYDGCGIEAPSNDGCILLEGDDFTTVVFHVDNATSPPMVSLRNGATWLACYDENCQEYAAEWKTVCALLNLHDDLRHLSARDVNRIIDVFEEHLGWQVDVIWNSTDAQKRIYIAGVPGVGGRIGETRWNEWAMSPLE